MGHGCWRWLCPLRPHLPKAGGLGNARIGVGNDASARHAVRLVTVPGATYRPGAPSGPHANSTCPRPQAFGGERFARGAEPLDLPHRRTIRPSPAHQQARRPAPPRARPTPPAAASGAPPRPPPGCAPRPARDPPARRHPARIRRSRTRRPGAADAVEGQRHLVIAAEIVAQPNEHGAFEHVRRAIGRPGVADAVIAAEDGHPAARQARPAAPGARPAPSSRSPRRAPPSAPAAHRARARRCRPGRRRG